MSRNAPRIGDPNSVAMAAKLPAAPITITAISGASFLTRRTASTPSPLPMAMSGASGPRTAPRHSVASEATTTPGRSMGSVAPAVLKPSAGLWPPVPCRYRSVSATMRPARTSGRIGHQAGTEVIQSFGRVWNTNCWASETNLR